MSGIYIHIPFCKSKCPYCDFYSKICDESTEEAYVNAVMDEVKNLKRCKEYVEGFSRDIDTIYLGGGTPSVLKGENIYKIITTIKENYNLYKNPEITIECNPSSPIEEILPYLLKSGVNRVSLGMQSAVKKERQALGRLADKDRIKTVIELLKSNGINNISLDIMLGVPFQTKESIYETLNFIKECDIPHISSYMLKIEEGTFFGKHRDKYQFPDDDYVCDLYDICADYLESLGYNHYEISNFAKPNFESRHNTKYWILDNYLGIGPAAHSYINGKRFYFKNDTQSFIDGDKPIFEGNGGDSEEYIMLRLRLKNGLKISQLKNEYGEAVADLIIKKAPLFKKQGLVNFNGEDFSLTRKGFLLSNSVISQLI